VSVSLEHPLQANHVRQQVNGAEDGEFRDIHASGVCDGALRVRVVGDRQERRAVAQFYGLDGTACGWAKPELNLQSSMRDS
jgi:hypothetical protein